MARIGQWGCELGAITTGLEFNVTTGTISASSTTKRTGSYSYRVNPTTSTGIFRYLYATSTQTKGGFFGIYINIATLPSVNVHITQFTDTGNGMVSAIMLTTTGTLRLINSSSAQVGSDSAALSTNTWYLIEHKHDSTSGNALLAGRVDGVSFASGTNSTTGVWARIAFGAVNTNTTTDLYFDDGALNDSVGSFQNTYPGSQKILHLKVAAAGDNATWTPTSGANYTNVDEVTPDDGTTVVSTSTLNNIDDYDIESASTNGIGASDTINVVMVGVRFRGDSASGLGNSSFVSRIKASSGGTVEESAAITPSTQTYRTNVIGAPATSVMNYPLILYDLPGASTTAFTQSDLETTQIGERLSSSNFSVSVSTVWVSVAYTPVVASFTPPKPEVVSQAVSRAANY